MHAIFLFAFCSGPSVFVLLTIRPIKKQRSKHLQCQSLRELRTICLMPYTAHSESIEYRENTCAFFSFKLLSSVRRNKCWCWTRVHCIHSVDWWRRWAVTNRNPRRVIRSNTTPLYFISQVNCFSDIFSFPLGTTILKPRFDLFVAELKRLC